MQLNLHAKCRAESDLKSTDIWGSRGIYEWGNIPPLFTDHAHIADNLCKPYMYHMSIVLDAEDYPN